MAVKRVALASQNPVKLEAVRAGFESMFPAESFVFEVFDVDSGVSAQPMSDLETLSGATQRAEKLHARCPQADFWVGVEGGVDPSPVDSHSLFTYAWIVVLGADGQGRARTGAFELPPRIARLVHTGFELGDADDLVFGTSNSKQANGAVGLLTGDLLTRTSFYLPAVQLALIPFKNPQLFMKD